MIYHFMSVVKLLAIAGSPHILEDVAGVSSLVS